MTNNYFKLTLFILLISLVFGSSVIAENQTKTYSNGKNVEIKWTDGYIESVGMAVPPDNVSNKAQGVVLAREGAIVDGRTHLLEYLKGVNIDSETTMANMMANVKINQEVKGFIRGTYVVENSDTWENNIYSIKMRKNIKEIYKIIYKENQDKFTSKKATQESNYTGLIIDARNINLTPQIMFEIRDETGEIIYSSAKAAYAPAIDRGLAGYAPSIKAAKNNPRVGQNPLIVKGVKATGEMNTVVVVSEESGQKLKNLFNNTDIFRKAKIIVVLDK